MPDFGRLAPFANPASHRRSGLGEKTNCETRPCKIGLGAACENACLASAGADGGWLSPLASIPYPRVCLIMDAASEGVSSATPEARIYPGLATLVNNPLQIYQTHSKAVSP